MMNYYKIIMKIQTFLKKYFHEKNHTSTNEKIL